MTQALSGTREPNGLRVLMALIDNWDVNTENNAIYQEHLDCGPERIQMVSDLGSSFGTPGLVRQSLKRAAIFNAKLEPSAAP